MKARNHERRSCDSTAGLHRRPGSLSPIRRRRKADSLCTAFNTCAPGTRLPQEGGCESQSARAETKGEGMKAHERPLPIKNAPLQSGDSERRRLKGPKDSLVKDWWHLPAIVGENQEEQIEREEGTVHWPCRAYPYQVAAGNADQLA